MVSTSIFLVGKPHPGRLKKQLLLCAPRLPAQGWGPLGAQTTPSTHLVPAFGLQGHI